MLSDELKILAWAPESLFYGVHIAHPLPVHAQIAEQVAAKRLAVLSELAINPAGFDGDRACITHWEHTKKGLYIESAWRSYSQGIAIRETYKEKMNQGIQLANPLNNQPDPHLSWGSTYTSVVLLPDNMVLAGLRSPHMVTNGNVWSVVFTEILEPSDISIDGMHQLPLRLVQEEMPELLKYGTPKLVGLGIREYSYTWQLIGVLDLRAADKSIFETIAALPADEETIAWKAVDIMDSQVTQNILGNELAKLLLERCS